MRDPEHYAECLYRIAEFRKWVRTNVLFPQVPDSIVKPMCDHLREAENALVILLYGEGEVDRVAAIEQQLQPAPRTPPAAIITPGKWPE
jgi:hypothetical protein